MLRMAEASIFRFSPPSQPLTQYSSICRTQSSSAYPHFIRVFIHPVRCLQYPSVDGVKSGVQAHSLRLGAHCARLAVEEQSEGEDAFRLSAREWCQHNTVSSSSPTLPSSLLHFTSRRSFGEQHFAGVPYVSHPTFIPATTPRAVHLTTLSTKSLATFGRLRPSALSRLFSTVNVPSRRRQRGP